MKVRTMKAAGLDIIEDKRDGACVWDITGEKYIDCQTGSGIMNVGRHNREIVDVLKKALDTGWSCMRWAMWRHPRPPRW